LWIGRLDDDDLRTLLDDFDLSAGFQIARGIRLRSHPLHRRKRVFLLCCGSISQRRSPRNILGEIVQHCGKLRQRLDGGIPVLLLGRLLQGLASQIWIGFQKIIRVHNLIGKRGGAKHLCDQRVRIQRDGRNQCIQFAVR
jgi:hypothetical protein